MDFNGLNILNDECGEYFEEDDGPDNFLISPVARDKWGHYHFIVYIEGEHNVTLGALQFFTDDNYRGLWHLDLTGDGIVQSEDTKNIDLSQDNSMKKVFVLGKLKESSISQF